MKAERLIRKTHLKRHAALPPVIDLTQEADDDMTLAKDSTTAAFDLTVPAAEAHALSSFAFRSRRDTSRVNAMPAEFETEADAIAWCAAVLAESPTAGRLFEEAARAGWSAGTADLHSGGFYLDTAHKQILLDHFSLQPGMLGRSTYFRNAFITTFIRALRDVWHEMRGDAVRTDYRPDHILMLERVRAADCDTVTIHVAWELRGAGFPDIWRHMLGAEEGDMAMIFTRYLERDPGALFDGSALACTFRQWYADPTRADSCDHQTLEALDDILLLAETHNPFGTRDLKPAEIEAMTQLPDGTNYLAGLGRTVMVDPVFAGLSDPVNQTHLFHLVYDTEVTMVNNVPFRDGRLARRIFPGGAVRTWR